MFAAKTLLVVCLTYIYAESNRSRIACVLLVVGTRFGLKFCKTGYDPDSKKLESAHLWLILQTHVCGCISAPRVVTTKKTKRKQVMHKKVS